MATKTRTAGRTSSKKVAKTEADIMREVQLAASKLGCRLFRNNVGMAKIEGRVIKYGLVKGSSDLIGWTANGRFLAVEVKRPGGIISPEQQRFIEAVNDKGGLGMVVFSAQDFEDVYIGK